MLILFAFLSLFSYAQTPLNPDVVILTESLSTLPEDLVSRSFLSKVLSKEKVFKYQDEPSYYQIQGFLKRIAFEHNVTVTDNIVKYLLEVPAEIGLWKSFDGKLSDFTFTTKTGKIKETIAQFLLNVANIASDTQVTSFQDGEGKGFNLQLGSKKLTISIRDGMIAVTTLGPTFLPWNITGGSEHWKNGLYSGFLKSELGKNKHRLIMSGEYVTLGYQYFFPQFKAMSFTFDNSHWSVGTRMDKYTGQFSDSTPLWKGLPLAPAMCIVVPVASDRVGSILESSKNLLGPKDVEAMIASPMAACWYEDSSLFTPLFAVKANAIPDLKEKLKGSFDKYIGTSDMKIKDSKETFELSKDESYENEKYTVKLALINGFIFFSPDSKLVDQAMATAGGKGTSVDEELKGDKTLSVLFSPFKVSGLLEHYLNDALPSTSESIFRTSLETYFISSFKNLSQVKPFVLSMPKPVEKPDWETLQMNEI
jgi:uncharacterized protein YfaA (DUF2138 family)